MLTTRVKNSDGVRFMIAKKGMSLRAFADSCEVSHSYLSQILNGGRNPSPTTAMKIAEGLGSKLEDIFFIESGRYIDRSGGDEKQHA